MHDSNSSAQQHLGAFSRRRQGDGEKRKHVERRLHAYRVHAQQERETQRQLFDFVREAGSVAVGSSAEQRR